MKLIKITILAILIALSAVIFTSCKKYEEGPAFSLRSKKARVVGKWKVEKWIENGNDVTNTVNMFSPKYEFKENGDLIYSIVFLGVTTTETDKWEFSGDKEKIILIDSNGREEWQILRLKNKEFWLKHVHGSDTDEVHLASIE